MQKAHEAMVKALADEGVKARLKDIGAVAVGSSPEELDRIRKDDVRRMEGVIKSRGIKLESGMARAPRSHCGITSGGGPKVRPRFATRARCGGRQRGRLDEREA